MIGERLRKLREERGLLQRQLADILKLTQQTISLYESNQREPDAETLKKIADFFNTTIDYLLGRTDDPNPPEKTIDDEIVKIMRELGPDITMHLYDLKGMTEEEKESFKIFLEGLRARRRQKEGKE
jgi:transcriptional regulator with XRE-family HTH domain